MRALVKIGGTLLDSPELRARLAGELAAAVRTGVHIVVVHGGGKQMTRYLADRGIESRFVDGLRVTTQEVLDAVLKIFAGSVNQELVAALIACGASAVGLTGMDALLTEASLMRGELGAVGKPVRSDARLLELLIENSYLPVVACVAGDRQGRFYNVNADQMAASIALAIRAEKLLFLTDVEGVKGPGNVIYSTLNLSECCQLIESEIATGGMRAKLEAALEALGSGLSEAVISPGAVPGILSKLVQGEQIGTRLLAEVEVTRNG
jgi:acetylglutamate kinase